MKVFGGVLTVPAAPHPFMCGICYKVQGNLWGLIHQQGTEPDMGPPPLGEQLQECQRGAELLVPLVTHEQGMEVQACILETEVWCCLLLDSMCSTEENISVTMLPKFLSTQQLREHREPRIWALTHKATSRKATTRR